LGNLMAEDGGKKEEEKLDFTPEGETLGYISLDQARVLAMRTAREAPGAYGRRFRNVPMAFEAVEDEETEDHYVVTLSFRPQGQFTGAPGQEQFFIEKEGAVAHRQVLSLPVAEGRWRFPVVPVAIGLVAVVIAAMVGVVLVAGSDGGDSPVAVLVPTSTSAPSPTQGPASPTVVPLVQVTTPVPTPTPTPALTPGVTPEPTRTTEPVPTSTPMIIVVTATPAPTSAPTPTPTPTPTADPTATPRPTSPSTPTPGPIVTKGLITFESWLVPDVNPEIFMMNADGSNQIDLTNHPAADKDPAWSPDGSKIAFYSDRDGYTDIYVMDADGSNQTNLSDSPVSRDKYPAWSPDGSKIAFTSDREFNVYLYVMDADGTNKRRLTTEPASDLWPTWSPDGTKLAFTSWRIGSPGIFVIEIDRSNETRLTDNEGDSQPAWSPNGDKIAFSRIIGGRNVEIHVMGADGSNVARLTDNPDSDDFPAWSPDGTKIAFSSFRDGTKEIYVMEADGTNQTRLTKDLRTDCCPSWSPLDSR
jgi:Tol biopolymer transport system component